MSTIRNLIDRASTELIRRNTGDGAHGADEPFFLKEFVQIAS
jgi:hypothetical protein